MFRSSWFYLLVLGLGLLTLGLVVRSGILAVKNPGEPINAAMRAAMAAEQPELTTEQSLYIDHVYPTAHVLTSGLRYLVLNPGHGDRIPRISDEVAVRYTGRLLGGAEFDSSDKHGGILTFHAGLGDVIKGWDEAILQMKKGEKRRLIVPWWLAYGDAGKPPVIPPRSVLVFDVELVDFR
jgi:FKBP-type peptidyl-prolyl cis-trans isomerase